MLELNVAVKGTQTLKTALGLVIERTDDLRPAWNLIHKKMLKWEKSIFKNEGNRKGIGYENPKWASLSPAYRAWKAKHYPRRKILVLTGELKRSLTEAAGKHIYKRNRLKMTFGTAVEYGIYHQYGTEKMPARPPLGFTDKDAQEIGRIIMRYLIQTIGAREYRARRVTL